MLNKYGLKILPNDNLLSLLCLAIEKNNYLMSIDFSYNTIGINGVKTLAKALKINKSITAVNLYCNNLCNAGDYNN